MDLNELEGKGIAKPKKVEKPKEIEQPHKEPEPQIVNERSPMLATGRRYDDWMIILKLSVVLALLVGMILGGVGGFFVGKVIYQGTSVGTLPENSNGTNDSANSIYSQFDYETMYINKKQNITIESFYSDDEERFFAMQLLGEKLPELTYITSEYVEKKVSDLGNGRYIIELVEPDCAFCNKMISVVDNYRETENAMQILTLSIKDGNIDAFNTKGENAFHLVNKDTETDDFVGMIVWVPTFLYVENGEIKHVTFGLMDDAEAINKNIDIAFNQ